MRRRERERKAANRLRGKPARGLARDMGGMVVENDLDRGVGRVSPVEELKKLDEFAAAVAFLDQGMDVTGEQIDTRHQGQGAVALVLVIAHHSRADAGKWRAIRRGRSDRLNPWFLVVRDDGEAPATAVLALVLPAFSLATHHRHLPVDTEDFGHFGLELRIALLQVVAHLVRPHFFARPIFCRPFLGPAFPSSNARRMVHVAGHVRRAAGSSTAREDNPTPWPSGTPTPPAKSLPQP